MTESAEDILKTLEPYITILQEASIFYKEIFNLLKDDVILQFELKVNSLFSFIMFFLIVFCCWNIV
jgi:hypothetical protein